MKDIVIGKTQNTAVQFIRYIFVGGIAAVADSGSLYFLYAHLGLNHLVAAAAGFLLGLLVNYAISIAWVFESSGRIKEEFTIFAMIGIGGLAGTELIMWIFVDLVHSPVMVAKGIALMLVLIWNFGMRKRFVFSAESA